MHLRQRIDLTTNDWARPACNECRQQKVSPPALPSPSCSVLTTSLQLKCNVQQDPFKSCDRCTKQRLKCVIEPNFKRVGKRNRNAEMEREMELLRERLAMYEGSSALSSQPILNPPQPSPSNHAFAAASMYKAEDDTHLQTQQSQFVADALLDLRSGSPMFHTLGDHEEVKLSTAQVNELFAEFFQLYHPFLPFLDPTRTPDEVYAKESKLLFWAIISVAARHYDADGTLLSRLKDPLTDLIWSTIKSHPNHHVVKAMCLLCTWPLPANTTVSDPTFMLCGVMMQIAIQIGLHQPTHPQDFSRTKVRLQEQDIHDRLRTWAVCNIVAQTYAPILRFA